MAKARRAKPPEDVWHDANSLAREKREVVVKVGEIEALAAELRPKWRSVGGRADKQALAEQLRSEASRWGKAEMGPALAVLAYEEACKRGEGAFWRLATRVLLGLHADEFRQASVFAKAMMQLEREGVAAGKTAAKLSEKGLDQRAREKVPATGKKRTGGGLKRKSNPMARRLAAKQSGKKPSAKV